MTKVKRLQYGVTRRDSLKYAGVALCGGSVPRTAAAHGRGDSRRIKPKSVAAVITAYQTGLHADVLIGEILEGGKQDGGPGSALKLAPKRSGASK